MSADREDPDVGLVQKFEVTRITPSSRGIDHSECRYFVLDPQHDPLARSALIGYAGACMEEGRDQLAAELLAWVNQCEETARLAGTQDFFERLGRIAKQAAKGEEES